MADAGPMGGVEALLAAVAAGTVLPAPAERVRLREAAGLTRAAVAQALGTRVASVEAWEDGRAEPAGDRREAYRTLLEGLARHYPVPTAASAAAPPASRAEDRDAEVESAELGPASASSDAAAVDPQAQADADASRTVPPAPATPPAPRAAGTAAPVRGAARRTSVEATPGAQFPDGPLLVLDGDGQAYGVGGLVVECPAKTLPALVAWALEQVRVGTPRLHPAGKDGDPLLVLTADAVARFKLPERLSDRVGQRLEENHPVIKALAKADWQLTRRGFGPWPRIYRPVAGGRRQCVQLAVVPWGALDVRAWGAGAATMPAPELARMLTVFAERVLTPVGGSATTGVELMTALRPPTHALRDGSGTWRSAALHGSLVVPVDPAPPEGPAEHPLAVGRPEGPAGVLEEESLVWTRDPELLTDAECAQPFALGIDVNTAYLAASSRLRVGLGEAVHVQRPEFDKKMAGSWLVDLSGLELDPRLPHPATPDGARPTGPAWYATPTVTYALELAQLLGRPLAVAPLEGWLRPDAEQLRQLTSQYRLVVPPAPWEDEPAAERLGLAGYRPEFLATVQRFAAGPYLDPWYARLRQAYLDTMAELGVTPELEPAAYLAAMARRDAQDPALLAVLSAIKATVKGGIGKLRERPQERGLRPGQPWGALRRATWRPDIRAAVISASRVNMHRKIMALALKANLYPLAVNVDCVLYASPGPSPLDLLPHDAAGKPLPGGFRLGVSPGMVKHEGSREFLWAAQLMDEGDNPARLVKGGGGDE